MYKNKRFRSAVSNTTDKSKADELIFPSTSGILTEQNKFEIPLPKQRKTIDASQESNESLQAIPQSQNQIHSQRRYLSQRHSQSIRSLKRLPTSYYESVLMRCGVDLDDPTCIIFNLDHITFVNKLRENLKAPADFPENVQRFLKGLKDVIKVESNLIKILSGCIMNVPNVEYLPQSQESLMKNFLMLDFMQSDLIEILIDKMKLIVVANNNEASELSILSLILSQLRFINHITNGDMLFEKIFEVISLANEESRHEIIGCLNDIIDFSRHNKCVRKLIEIIPNDKDLLTITSVDTFANMSLNAELQMELRSKIIHFINDKVPISLLPSLIKFILIFNDEEKNVLPDIIYDLRLCLNWNYDNETIQVINDSKLLIFQLITKLLTNSKKLFDAWLKSIQHIGKQNDHRPIDIVILIIMMSINDEKSNYIENLFRRKIKNDLFTIKLMESTVADLAIIIVEYKKNYLQLIDNFFRDRDLIVSKFGNTGYKLIFGIPNCDKKVVLSKLIAFVSEKKIVTAYGLTSIDLSTNALNLLTEINKKYPLEMLSNGLQLFRIIDRVCDLNITQFRLVMNLLCSIAYSQTITESTGQLQEQIDMLIKKQVTSSILQIKHRGIIGVLRVIDYIVWKKTNEINENLNDSFSSNKTINSIDELPDGPGKKAAELFALILTTTTNCIESLTLAFDELARILSQKYCFTKDLPYLDKHFLSWLCELITNDFQECFIVHELSNDNEIDMSFQCCINKQSETCVDDENETIKINIGDKSMKPYRNAISSINLLSSLFHLLRVLHFLRDNGTLESINAVLGCGILLPNVMDPTSDIDIFDEFPINKCKNIVDIYFYTINFYREIIGGFCSQNDLSIKKKVLLRLTNLVELETTVRKLIKRMPSDYMPPICHFIEMKNTNDFTKFKKPAVPLSSSQKKSSNNKVSKKKIGVQSTVAEQQADTEGMSILATVQTQQNISTSNIPSHLLKDKKCHFSEDYGIKEIYRQIDPDIMLLLKETLKIEIIIPKDCAGEYLGLLEFKFIMQDLVSKFESITGIRKFTIEQQQDRQLIISPSDFINDFLYFLPRIMIFIDQFSYYIKNCIKLSNGNYEDPILFTDEINYTKLCFGLCFRLLAAIFSWPNFDEEDNEKMLKDFLCIVGKQTKPNDLSVKELTLLAINNIKSYENTVLDLKTGVHLFHLLKSLSHLINENNILNEICKKYLKQMWYNFDGTRETGTKCNILLDALLKGFFKNVKLITIKNNVKIILDEVKMLKKKNSTLKTFPCFHNGNFPLLFRTICGAFITTLNTEIETGNSVYISRIKTWEMACGILTSLLEIIKNLDMQRNFSLFLKHAHIFLKFFLQNGIDVIEGSIKNNAERVNELLKSLQLTTRFLHNLCCHSKKIKNTSIINQIPLLRQTIEVLVLRVKAALTLNNCSSVFFMGNLKNKDLHGDEILSQISTLSQNDEDDCDGLPDDDDIDEEIGLSPLESTSNNSSRSECL